MGGETSVNIEIYGFDFAQTDAVANEIARRMRNVKGCSQVNISREDYIPEYQIDFDREKLAINGLNVTTASMYLRNRVNGSTASKYREDGDEYDIKVRYAPEFRESVEDLENILIYNNEGKGIRIRDLGKVVERMTPPTIERKDRERVITVSAVAGKGAALSDLVAAARNELKQMDIPSDVSWPVGWNIRRSAGYIYRFGYLDGIDHHLGIHRDGCPVRVVGRPVRDHVLYPVRLYRYRIGIGGHADTIGRYGFDRREHVDGYRG